jgi:hypothetical protein
MSRTITLGTARKVARILEGVRAQRKVIFTDPEDPTKSTEGELRGLRTDGGLMPYDSDDLSDVNVWITVGGFERYTHISELVEDLDETFHIIGEP